MKTTARALWSGVAVSLALISSSCKDRITVLEGGKPVKGAAVRVYFDSAPKALEATTDKNGVAAIKIKHKELVVSVGIFTKDGRQIAVGSPKKWPLEVHITKDKRQLIK